MSFDLTVYLCRNQVSTELSVLQMFDIEWSEINSRFFWVIFSQKFFCFYFFIFCFYFQWISNCLYVCVCLYIKKERERERAWVKVSGSIATYCTNIYLIGRLMVEMKSHSLICTHLLFISGNLSIYYVLLCIQLSSNRFLVFITKLHTTVDKM